MTSLAQFLTVEQVAQLAQLSADNVRRRCATGQIEAVKVGKVWRISQTAFDDFMSPGFRPAARRRLTARQRQQIGKTA